MEFIEQLLSEVSDRAGSPDGFLRLIKLLLAEVEKIDVRDPNAYRLYITLIRAYVLVKRQLTIFNRRCENVAIDTPVFDDTVRRLKYAIRIKRDEAREYAAKSIPPDRLKDLKRYAGTHLGFGLFAQELTSVPIPYRGGSEGITHAVKFCCPTWIDPSAAAILEQTKKISKK